MLRWGFIPRNLPMKALYYIGFIHGSRLSCPGAFVLVSENILAGIRIARKSPLVRGALNTVEFRHELPELVSVSFVSKVVVGWIEPGAAVP